MQRWFQRLISVAVAAAAAIALLGLPVAAQQPQTYRGPRLAGTQNPDLNGIWEALNSADWDLEPHAAGPSPYPAILGAMDAIPPGQGVIEGGRIPYQDWALAKKKQNFEKRLARPTDRETNETTGDPEAKCYLPGVPRATYMPYPFRLVQTSKQVLFAYQFASATRIVFLDRKPTAPSDSWMGWSVAHWEGETLVIDVTDLNDHTWFDRAGNFHSGDLHVVERYTPMSPYHLMYQATIEDPKVFTRPWTITMPLYRRMEKNAQLLEFKCVEFAEEFIYGHLVEKPAR
jgi:hypothetical protein